MTTDDDDHAKSAGVEATTSVKTDAIKAASEATTRDLSNKRRA
jgi:hypothetical protein